MKEVKEYTNKIFEDIKHIDEFGNEYWLARELQKVIDYSKWENFNKVIKKAILAYKNSTNNNLYWLPEVRKPIITGKRKKEFILDYKLSRYACYLIAKTGIQERKQLLLLKPTLLYKQENKNY